LKIALISDIHGNIEALNAVMDELEAEKPFKHLICLGDIVGYYPNPLECINIVRKNCDIVIKGNHDASVISTNFENKIKWYNEIAATALKWTRNKLLEENNESQFRYLRGLRIKREINIGKFKFLFVHGTPEKKWEYFLYPYWSGEPIDEQMERINIWFEKWDLIALGHTHWAFQYQRNGQFVVNPGSVGQPRDENPEASYSIVEIKENRIEVKLRRIPYDIEKTCRALVEAKLPQLLCERLFLGK
jgi:putative phosphoesterase